MIKVCRVIIPQTIQIHLRTSKTPTGDIHSIDQSILANSEMIRQYIFLIHNSNLSHGTNDIFRSVSSENNRTNYNDSYLDNIISGTYLPYYTFAPVKILSNTSADQPLPARLVSQSHL